MFTQVTAFSRVAESRYWKHRKAIFFCSQGFHASPLIDLYAAAGAEVAAASPVVSFPVR